MIKTKPNEIYKEYIKDKAYKQSLGLSDNVELFNKFYHGDQWDGVNAPDLQKPVFNILKPAIKYYVSMIVSDDIGVSVDDFDDTGQSQQIEGIIKNEIDKVFEANRFGYKTREHLKSTAIDGDSCMFCYIDDKPAGNMEIIGADGATPEPYEILGNIRIELVDNTRVHFANPAEHSLQEQMYVILSFKRHLDELQAELKDLGLNKELEALQADNEDDTQTVDSNDTKYATVFLKFWKENGSIKFTKCTKDIVITEETDLNIDIYPIVYQSWERKKNSYHGVSAIKAEINNQIFVNQIFAMAMEYQKRYAFPKVMFDKTKIPTFDNRIGTAVGVNGPPKDVIFNSFAPQGMNNQAIELANITIDKTKDVLGVFDAALGNVKPDNTSAIVAVQRAASQPLELQKMDFYQAVEDMVRIIVKMMATNYGIRNVKQTQVFDNPMTGESTTRAVIAPFDFTNMINFVDRVNIEIGGASYWSELTQVQTLDNLMGMGIIPDALTYLEAIPDGYIKNKQKIIDRIKELKEQQVPPQPAEQAPPMGEFTPTI